MRHFSIMKNNLKNMKSITCSFYVYVYISFVNNMLNGVKRISLTQPKCYNFPWHFINLFVNVITTTSVVAHSILINRINDYFNLYAIFSYSNKQHTAKYSRYHSNILTYTFMGSQPLSRDRGLLKIIAFLGW